MSYLSFDDSCKLNENFQTFKDQAKEMKNEPLAHRRYAFSKPAYLLKLYDMNRANSELVTCIQKFGKTHNLNVHTRERLGKGQGHSPVEDMLHNHEYHAEGRIKEVESQGLFKSFHTATSNWPLSVTTDYGPSMINLYITFDTEKIHSVKALMGKGENLKRTEIPGAKEIIMKYKKK